MNAEHTAERIELIKSRLAVLNPIELDIIDDSHKHQGHEAQKQGASHFTVRIRCAEFNTLSRVEQQRLVYSQLSDLMPFPIHALALQTLKTES